MEILVLIKEGKITDVNNVGNIVYFTIKDSSAPEILECKNELNAETIVDKYSLLIG